MKSWPTLPTVTSAAALLLLALLAGCLDLTPVPFDAGVDDAGAGGAGGGPVDAGVDG